MMETTGVERQRRLLAIVREAALLVDADRAEYLMAACGDDAALRDEADELLTLAQVDDGFLDGSAPIDAIFDVDQPASMLGRRIGPYVLEAVLGAGGMGVVYRARRVDGGFDQQVAIKLVRPAPGQPIAELARRLRHERQILASLQHPNVARLLDGGATTDGLPYVVMEYVDGQPIDVACTMQRLPIDARVRLMRTVCLAVQGAHQRLIIHRDLKPSNILVIAEGTPMLLDFGIATLVTPDAAAALQLTLTELGPGPLTLAYASPEQMRGEPLTTASDVYALGLVLYELLTGVVAQRASSGRLAEWESIICDEEPVRPSAAATVEQPANTREPSVLRLRRRLAGDLDQVVLMALRKEPSRRYPTAQALADDLERHLTGLPVQARPDTVRYRAGKFVRRHIGALVASTLVLLALVAGLVATTWQAYLAESQRQSAETQRLLAERRFDDVRQLARSLMYEVHDEIAKVPGSTAARQLVVDRARAYLDRLALDVGSDRALLRDVADAYIRVGAVQGGISGPSLGDTAGALDRYQQAQALQEQLANDTSDIEAQRDLGLSHYRIGDMLVRIGNVAEALESHQRGLALREQVVVADPTNIDALIDLAQSLLKQAEVFGRLGRTDEAVASYRQSLAMLEPLLGTRPQVMADLSTAYESFSTLLMKTNDTAAIQSNLERALALREQLAATAGGDSRPARVLSGVYITYGHFLIRVGAMGDSLAAFRKALAVRERLAAADPRDAQAKRDLNVVRSTLGDLLAVTGALGEAVVVQRQTVASREELAAADPANRGILRDLGVSYERLGEALFKTGDTAGALASQRQGLALRHRLTEGNPNDARARHDLTTNHLRLGEVLLRTGDAEGARASFQAAHVIAAALAAADVKDAAARTELTIARRGVGLALALAGDLGTGRSAVREALAAGEVEAAADPKNAELQRDLSGHAHAVGAVLARSGDTVGAVTLHQRGLAIRERLANDFPADTRARRDLADSLVLVGSALTQGGDQAAAVAHHQRALDLYQALASDQADTLVRRGLGAAQAGLGDARLREGDPAGALTSYHAAHAVWQHLADRDTADVDLQQTLATLASKIEAATTIRR